MQYKGPTLVEAMNHTKKAHKVSFGCVCIPERHLSKGNEHLNMIKKIENGAEWFITQGVYSAPTVIKLLNEYGDVCKEKGITPKKIILTFAPCGRAKTMTFIKWLGMEVPAEAESRIFASSDPVKESMALLCEILAVILENTGNSGVPLGINVESLSIYREEIDAAHELFQKLQVLANLFYLIIIC
jgi:5,10-methylenetetrahydrofolate reductase